MSHAAEILLASVHSRCVNIFSPLIHPAGFVISMGQHLDTLQLHPPTSWSLIVLFMNLVSINTTIIFITSTSIIAVNFWDFLDVKFGHHLYADLHSVAMCQDQWSLTMRVSTSPRKRIRFMFWGLHWGYRAWLAKLQYRHTLKTASITWNWSRIKTPYHPLENRYFLGW